MERRASLAGLPSQRRISGFASTNSLMCRKPSRLLRLSPSAMSPITTPSSDRCSLPRIGAHLKKRVVRVPPRWLRMRNCSRASIWKTQLAEATRKPPLVQFDSSWTSPSAAYSHATQRSWSATLLAAAAAAAASASVASAAAAAAAAAALASLVGGTMSWSYWTSTRGARTSRTTPAPRRTCTTRVPGWNSAELRGSRSNTSRSASTRDLPSVGPAAGS
mmetsp:Transcript_6803/g.15787  ORF Transcript_6803/g.15787 Transcript_6803/m.15787 type:complete len:219 (-) Transcript_6803:1278-1934(-)